MPEERLTLTVLETARLLNVCREAAYKGVHDGTIPSIRIGRRILVPRQPLLDMLSPPAGTGGRDEHQKASDEDGIAMAASQRA